MKRMPQKLQLKVFCETAEAYFDREITAIKRRGDEHGVQIKALRRLRKAVRDSVAALGGGSYPASFRVNLTLACPKGVDGDDWSYDIEFAFWEVVSGVEYALFNDNWLTGLSSNIIHSHYQIEFQENGKADVSWLVVLKDICRPNPLMCVWVEDAKSDCGGYEKFVRLWTTDADNLPQFVLPPSRRQALARRRARYHASRRDGGGTEETTPAAETAAVRNRAVRSKK